MRDDPVKIGMAGAGFILRSHALAAREVPGAKLEVVADASLSRAQQAAEAYGFSSAATSLDELARSECDVVHILLPPTLHASAARMMLEAGKSVFIEKPMGLDPDECHRLCELATSRGLKIGVNHNFLFGRNYQSIRQACLSRQLGPIDHLAINWLYDLPAVRTGPFDAWMLEKPANLLFELGPHLLGFAQDLVGGVTIHSARASFPIVLPCGHTVYRHWTAAGESETGSFVMTLSVMPGHADRSISLRGAAASARYDYGRDFGWVDSNFEDNPIFDAYRSGRAILGGVKQAARERRRRVRLALGKRAWANPFEESVAQSIWTFYSSKDTELDPRLDGRMGARLIELAQQIATAAGLGRPSTSIEPRPAKNKVGSSPTVLVVGGTGFIGAPLVRALVAQGLGVRLLTRNKRSAELMFADIPIDIVQGSHGDMPCAAESLVGIQTVYHLAKCEGKKWADYLRDDVEPTRVLGEAAASAGVRRFIFTGTIDSYSSDDAGERIDNYTALDEQIETRNLYARSKANCESVLRGIAARTGLNVVILRPGIVIGEGSPLAHVGVARFRGPGQAEYWGAGTRKLPLVLVDDVVSALMRAKDQPNIDGQSFLVTGPPLLSARDYIRELTKWGGTAISAKPRSPWAYWLADLLKEIPKKLVRHPNRRTPTLHDWKCRAHAATFDSSGTQQALDWHPVSNASTLIARSIGRVTQGD